MKELGGLLSPHEPLPLSEPLEARLAALEARVATLEQTAGKGPAPLPAAPLPAELQAPIPLEAASAVPILGGIGRIFLILGGAFFLRALTEGGTLPHALGVGLGLAYGLLWVFQAWRTARPGDASFQILASVLITYPLLLEATTTFAVVHAPGAAFLLLALVTLHLAVSWHRNLEALTWISLLVGLGTGFVLLATTHALELFSGAFLILGGGVLWMTYGRRWHGLRWPTALATDGVVLLLAILAAWPGGPPEAYRGLQSTRSILLAMALPILYIGSFAWRMLKRHRVVNAFEGLQSALALVIGFGGAVRIALASGTGIAALGFSVLAAGAGCYAAALPFASDHEEVRGNFNFFTSLGLVFLMVGSPVLLPLGAYSLLAAILGLAAITLGLRFRRTVPIIQGALCLGVASVTSGLLVGFFGAFRGLAQDLGPLPPAASAVAGALIVAAFLLEHKRPPEGFPTRLRITMLLLGILSVASVGGLTLLTILHLGGVALAQPAVLALLRTAVLSFAAMALALHARRCPQGVLRWLAYPVLALAGLKFLLEDLPLGRPMMLFLGFMCLGTALILTPRLLKTQGPESPAEPGKV